MVNVALTGFIAHEVPQMADFSLADAVDSPKPLFDTIWIPWQIVVNHQMGHAEG